MKNNIITPVLLIAAMLPLTLFQRVIFGYAFYNETDAFGAEVKYIIYNNEKYVPEHFFMLSFISYIFAFIIPVLFYIKLFKSEGYTKELYIKLPELKNISLVLYALGALISGTALLTAFIYFLGGPLELKETAAAAEGTDINEMSAVLAFVLIPAVCEEVLFRAVIVREYKNYGVICACLVSSAAGAMLRFSFMLFPVYFFAGTILYILIKTSGSVFLTVTAHTCYNFFNIYVWNKFSNVLRFEQNRLIFVFLAVTVFAVSVIALINKTEKIYAGRADSGASLPEPVEPKTTFPASFKAVFLSPMFLAAVIVYFICTVTA